MNALTTQTHFTKTHVGNFGPTEETAVYRLSARGVELGLMGIDAEATRIGLGNAFGSQLVEAGSEEEALEKVAAIIGMEGQRTLTLSTGSFDQEHSFMLEVGGYRGKKSIRCKLYQGYKAQDDGVYWAMQCCGVVKSQYTSDDRRERDRLNVQTPVRHGDVVIIDGAEYCVQVLGDYSNAAIFVKLGA